MFMAFFFFFFFQIFQVFLHSYNIIDLGTWLSRSCFPFYNVDQRVAGH